MGEGWGPYALVQTRMLANCKLGSVSSITVIAFTGDEGTLKLMFKLMNFITLSDFRGVYLGVMEGTIRPIFGTCGHLCFQYLPSFFNLLRFSILVNKRNLIKLELYSNYP